MIPGDGVGMYVEVYLRRSEGEDRGIYLGTLSERLEGGGVRISRAQWLDLDTQVAGEVEDEVVVTREKFLGLSIVRDWLE